MGTPELSPKRDKTLSKGAPDKLSKKHGELLRVLDTYIAYWHRLPNPTARAKRICLTPTQLTLWDGIVQYHSRAGDPAEDFQPRKYRGFTLYV